MGNPPVGRPLLTVETGHVCCCCYFQGLKANLCRFRQIFVAIIVPFQQMANSTHFNNRFFCSFVCLFVLLLWLLLSLIIFFIAENQSKLGNFCMNLHVWPHRELISICRIGKRCVSPRSSFSNNKCSIHLAGWSHEIGFVRNLLAELAASGFH